MRTKNAIINMIVSLAMQAVTLICGFIIPKLIIENYGSDVNGLISSITQFLGYITLLEAGMGPVIKSALYKPIYEKDNEKVEKVLKFSEGFFRKLSLVFLGYILILMLVYPLFSNTSFDYFYTSTLIAIIGVSTFAEYFFGMTYKLFLQADKKAYVPSIIMFVSYIVNIFAIATLVNLGFSIHIVKFATCVIYSLRPIIQLFYIKKNYKFNLKDSEEAGIKQKWDGLSQHIAYVIHNSTDTIILTLFSNISEVSVYSIYAMIVNGINTLIQACNSRYIGYFWRNYGNRRKSKIER